MAWTGLVRLPACLLAVLVATGLSPHLSSKRTENHFCFWLMQRNVRLSLVRCGSGSETVRSLFASGHSPNKQYMYNITNQQQQQIFAPCTHKRIRNQATTENEYEEEKKTERGNDENDYERTDEFARASHSNGNI